MKRKANKTSAFQAQITPTKSGGIQLLFVFFLAISATLAMTAVDCSYFPAFIRQNDSRSYLQTTGVILQSEIKLNYHTGATRSQTSYPTAVIRYTYSVDGLAFESDRYRYLGTYSDAGVAVVVNALQKGAPVTVYYNPRNIRDSILSPGLSKTDVKVVVIMGLVNLLLAGFWVGAWLKFRNKNRSEKNPVALPTP